MRVYAENYNIKSGYSIYRVVPHPRRSTERYLCVAACSFLISVMRRRFLICILLLMNLANSGQVKSASLSGSAEVLTGDTLTVSGTKLRLTGIDAPEKGQICQVASGRSFDCGRISATALMDLTVATSVICQLTGETSDDLPLARCTAGGYDLSKGMVHTGWALAWPRTGTIYATVEDVAREKKRGLWRGTFIKPWDWRRTHRRLAN